MAYSLYPRLPSFSSCKENRTPQGQFWEELATQLLLAAAPSCWAARFRRAFCIRFELPSREQMPAAMREQLSSGSPMQPWHTQPRQLHANDLLAFVSVAVGDLGTPGREHIHATAFGDSVLGGSNFSNSSPTVTKFSNHTVNSINITEYLNFCVCASMYPCVFLVGGQFVISIH